MEVNYIKNDKGVYQTIDVLINENQVLFLIIYLRQRVFNNGFLNYMLRKEVNTETYISILKMMKI